MTIDDKKVLAIAQQYTDDVVASVSGGIDHYEVDGLTLKIYPVEGKMLSITFTEPADGVSVSNLAITDGHLIVTLSDGTTVDAGVLPKGADGEDGVSVSDVDIIDNHLIQMLSNGQQLDAGLIPTGRHVIKSSTDSIMPARGYLKFMNSDVEDDEENDVTKVTPKGSGGGSAELSSAVTAVVACGGISVGKSYEAGTSLETVIRDMIDPVLFPTLANPSAALAATGTKLLEKGATLNTTFTVTFSRGSINPAYGTSGYRSGAATGYSLNGGTEQEENTFSETVTEAQTSYQAAVSYAAGEQPKDSSGANYNTPLAAGSVNSNTVSYEFVYALWANTSAADTISKQTLVSKSAKVKAFSFPATTAANPETFDVPASWTVTGVEVLNTLSGQWENAAAQFTVTDTTHDDAAGTSVNYKRYACNLGMSLGARQVRVKWS